VFGGVFWEVLGNQGTSKNLQNAGEGAFPTFPFSPLPFLSPSSPPLEVGPLKQLGSVGEHCKLLQRSPGRVPAENEVGAL